MVLLPFKFPILEKHQEGEMNLRLHSRSAEVYMHSPIS